MTLKSWLCRHRIISHRYDLSEVPETSLFYRLDCERCGGAPIDGAKLLALVKRNPKVGAFLGYHL